MDIKKYAQKVSLEPKEDIVILSVGVSKSDKKAFNEIQNMTNKNFSKVLREMISSLIKETRNQLDERVKAK